MSWALALQALETVAVVAGVLFGLIQLRQIRMQREIQTAVELLHPLQAPDFAEAVLLVHALPEGLDEAALKKRLGPEFRTVLALLGVFESLGPMIARGYIPMETYAEFYRGPTMLCWNRLRAYIEARRRSGWPMLFEWLQWLAEQLEGRGAARNEEPAFDRFRTWRSSSDYERLSCGRSAAPQ
jgi:hypothetical protein